MTNAARDFIEKQLIPFTKVTDTATSIFIEQNRAKWDKPEQGERVNEKEISKNDADWSIFTTGGSVIADAVKTEPLPELPAPLEKGFDNWEDVKIAINALIDWAQSVNKRIN